MRPIAHLVDRALYRTWTTRLNSPRFFHHRTHLASWHSLHSLRNVTQRAICTYDAYTYGAAKEHTTEQILQERREAATALPVSIPPLSLQKRARPSRVTDLYNVLVYEDDSKAMMEEWRKVVVVKTNGERLDDELNERIRLCLEDCRQVGHAEGAIEVLRDIEKEGHLPSVRAVIMAIEACLPAEEFGLAEEALKKLSLIPRTSGAWSKRLFCSAKTLVAFAHTSHGQFEDAMRVMGLCEFRSLNWRRKEEVGDVLTSIGLGRDTVAWGVIVKSLTKLNMAQAAVDVVDVAMSKGVGMTDSLLHLTIEALRAMDKWRQAEWVFDRAVEKGLKPRERTIASMLLSLISFKGKRAASMERLEQLLGMVSEPSTRFLGTALKVLTESGLLERAEEVFQELVKGGEGGVADEIAFSLLMGGYGTYLQLGSEVQGKEMDSEKVYKEVDGKVERHLEQYLRIYGRRAPASSVSRKVRVKFLTRYLRAKVRCFYIREAVDVLEQLGRKVEKFQWFELKMIHVNAVLGAIELRCDVSEMRRVMRLMEEVGMRYDVRSLAFCVGTLLGDGDLQGALELMRREGPRLLGENYLDGNLKEYHWVLMLRRLEMLDRGLRDSGMGRVRDLAEMIEVVKRRQGREGGGNHKRKGTGSSTE